MANPQKENGYTAIANEILEHIVKMPLPPSEYQMLFFVLRKTYGYQKKEDRISLTQFELGTGLSRPSVVKALKNLISRSMLVKTPLLAIKLNKDWESWVVNPPLLVKYSNRAGKPAFTEIGKPALTYKRKKEITKERAEQAPQDIVQIIENFEKHVNPSCKQIYGNITQRKACKFLLDTYGLERIITIIQKILPKTNKIPFCPTITTPLQLQEKWSALEASIIKIINKPQAKKTIVI